ncbi:DUF2138 domain-containing protein [Cronobacter sakazakii]
MTSVIPVPFYYKKSMKISIVVSFILAGAIATYAAISTREEKDPVIIPWAPKNDLGVDVSEPDVLIDSSSLSKLPADILSVPLLKDTLTEDFVFYYQNNADKLGLTGSLQRIVYEHHLTLKDSLINELLNQPAKIALWRDHKGKLNHFIMVIHRSGLAKMLEPLAHVVAGDSQLSKASPETIQVGNRGIALYKLRYNGQKSLLFASDGDKMVLLSGERFLFKDNKQVADTTALLNDLFHDKQPWNEAFSLTPAAGSKTKKAFQQQILVRSSYLAMGYQRFIPAFKGIRFDKDVKGWHSYLALNGSDESEETSLDFSPVWQTMPSGAGLCVALPLSRRMPAYMLRHAGIAPKVSQKIGDQFSGTAGLCWYPQSRLYSPLLVAQLTDAPGESWDDSLATLFSQFVGKPNQPVEATSDNGMQRWQREIPSRYAPYPGSQSHHPDADGRFFRVSLAHYQQTVVFSLDDTLVDNALRTLRKNFPPMSDVLPAKTNTALYFAPARLADIFKQEAYSSLPQEMEPVFYNAAQTLLYPRLTTLAKEPAYAVTLPKGADIEPAPHWIPLEWLPL